MVKNEARWRVVSLGYFPSNRCRSKLPIPQDPEYLYEATNSYVNETPEDSFGIPGVELVYSQEGYRKASELMWSLKSNEANLWVASPTMKFPHKCELHHICTKEDLSAMLEAGGIANENYFFIVSHLIEAPFKKSDFKDAIGFQFIDGKSLFIAAYSSVSGHKIRAIFKKLGYEEREKEETDE